MQIDVSAFAVFGTRIGVRSVDQPTVGQAAVERDFKASGIGFAGSTVIAFTARASAGADAEIFAEVVETRQRTVEPASKPRAFQTRFVGFPALWGDRVAVQCFIAYLGTEDLSEAGIGGEVVGEIVCRAEIRDEDLLFAIAVAEIVAVCAVFVCSVYAATAENKGESVGRFDLG